MLWYRTLYAILFVPVWSVVSHLVY